MIFFQTDEFPQADMLVKVEETVAAVAEGRSSDSEIEEAIRLDSAARQGRYYRKAAELLGFIQTYANHSVVAELGWELLQLETREERDAFLLEQIKKQRLFEHLFQYIERDRPTAVEFRDYIVKIYPGARETGFRRAATIRAWLRDVDAWPRTDPPLPFSKSA